MTEKTKSLQAGSLGDGTKTSATTPDTPAHTPLQELDRAINRIMGIEIEAMGGDNLSVVLCRYFDSDDGSEPDDNGWSDSAINAYEEIKQEIAGKFVPVREAIIAVVREAMDARAALSQAGGASE